MRDRYGLLRVGDANLVVDGVKSWKRSRSEEPPPKP